MGNPRRNGGRRDEALHAAAREGDLAAVQSICTSNPLAVNSRDKHSRTPLHLAAWSGQTDVVSYLCKNKADVNAAAMDDMGAIHFAAQKGHLEVVRTLLLSGVSIKSCTRKGFTALHYAAQGSNLELVKYLVRKGANPRTTTKSGKTPLDLATKEDIVSFIEECQLSKNKGEDPIDKVNSEDLDTEPSMEDKTAGSSDEPAAKHKEEQAEDSKDEKLEVGIEDQDNVHEDLKRKGDRDETDSDLSKTKKAKVALSHLLASDDAEEEH